jgi:hypothetical protein
MNPQEKSTFTPLQIFSGPTTPTPTAFLVYLGNNNIQGITFFRDEVWFHPSARCYCIQLNLAHSSLMKLFTLKDTKNSLLNHL